MSLVVAPPKNNDSYRFPLVVERNLALQDEVYRLRHETQEAFTNAKTLLAKQKDLDREQRELYQVCESA